MAGCAAWQVGSDPFAEMRLAKRERTQKNEKQQMGNLKVALKESGPRALPGTVRLAASLPQHGKGRPTKRKDMEDDVRCSASDAVAMLHARSGCWLLLLSSVHAIGAVTVPRSHAMHWCAVTWWLAYSDPAGV